MRAWFTGIFDKMTLLEILCLYLAFRVKQVVCDFFLQNSWMAMKKGDPFKDGGLKPLAAHALVHGTGTLIVVSLFALSFWWLAIIDILVHGGIDKAKGAITRKSEWNYGDDAWWWLFGLDQEAHNLTHLAFIVLIVIGSGTPLQ